VNLGEKYGGVWLDSEYECGVISGIFGGLDKC